ncbi:hypothetical protein F0U61_18885 [Archangium violaceum]|uniref:hypothetical protein n=1 Tax=Archangium violaceum TaxID=83451 RepID=UPI002B2EC806|nr:hypothetical protein F0U61_18885 [Archangium violaceum]
MLRRFILGAALCLSGEALAKPPAGSVFCTTYPSASVCTGQQPSCTYCHVAPPQRNSFGAGLESHLAPGAPRPLSDNDFAYALPTALRAVEAADADGDGVPNLVEIQRGTLPADANSFPVDTGGCAAGTNPQYDVCRYDTRFAYRRVLLDFCGQSPTYAQLKEFAALNADEQRARLDAELDRCTQSDFWRGKDGQLWKLAHPKIRPVGSLKSGQDEGAIPLADYYDDYALYAYSQIDDHDARDVMTAKYFVRWSSNPTRYSITTQPNTFLYVQDEKYRAGNITSSWSLIYFVMFTALPRNAASQAYRAYLGYDIAKQEGLYSIPNEPRDYDAKGVTEPACAACHATLDPLSYPFRNYQGLSLTDQLSSANYIPNRLETYFSDVAPTITQTPEAGYIFGQPVNNLVEWAQVGANSDAFAIATVTDYWKLLIGHAPTPEEHAEFVATWQRFKGTHQYRVQRMLHDLIRTEAYGAP